ncbi:MAG TPA: hypothetical protein VNK45_09615, partial [Candidatus Acidoferrales bacterium]|nr:hypothetical protein [Candidatus Acidoferrales bacterium]
IDRQRANDRPNNPQSSRKSARIARGSLRSEFGHRQAHCLAILMGLFSVSLWLLMMAAWLASGFDQGRYQAAMSAN